MYGKFVNINNNVHSLQFNYIKHSLMTQAADMSKYGT